MITLQELLENSSIEEKCIIGYDRIEINFVSLQNKRTQLGLWGLWTWKQNIVAKKYFCTEQGNIIFG